MLKAVKTGAFIIPKENSAHVVGHEPGIQHQSRNTEFSLIAPSVTILLKILPHSIESVVHSKQDYYLAIDTSLNKTNGQYSQQIGLFVSAYLL